MLSNKCNVDTHLAINLAKRIKTLAKRINTKWKRRFACRQKFIFQFFFKSWLWVYLTLCCCTIQLIRYISCVYLVWPSGLDERVTEIEESSSCSWNISLWVGGVVVVCCCNCATTTTQPANCIPVTWPQLVIITTSDKHAASAWRLRLHYLRTGMFIPCICSHYMSGIIYSPVLTIKTIVELRTLNHAFGKWEEI